MQFFLLGLAALVIALLAAKRFTTANPAIMASQLRKAGGIIALGIAVVLLVRGSAGLASLLGLFGVSLLYPKAVLPYIGFPGSTQKSPGQSSQVSTEHLEMQLDLDTGEMTGRVIKGIFKGRTIESLRPADIALLWQDCRFDDPQSAQVLEAYLDRIHPSWREDVARGEREMSGGPDGRMTPDEAYEILGLKPGASEEVIRQAHRDLMLKFHPDRGGSNYIASKINEAKDVLLG